MIRTILVLLACCASLDAAQTTRLLDGAAVPLVSREAVLMGTQISVLIATDRTDAAHAAITAALAEMARIEDMMTDWRDESALMAINHAAGQAAVGVPPELFSVLQDGVDIGRLTHGAFDITWKGGGRTWDFAATEPRIPDAATIEAARQRIDYRQLELDADAGTAFLTRPDMAIGLGGIAKGYAVDRAAALIEAAGFKDFVVNAGGDLLVRGHRGEALWRVGIRHPRDGQANIVELPVANVAIVTSGDYERFVEIDGTRYCHIIDPRTGWPARECQSVTILAERACWADAFATGVFVLGPTEGMALIESHPGLEGIIIDAEGGIHRSSGIPAPQARNAE